MKCNQCKYVRKLYDWDEKGNRYLTDKGECLRYPPTVLTNNMRNFPIVMLFIDSCGEYSVIDEKSASEKEKKDQLDIMYLDLSARAMNCLTRHNIQCYGQAKHLTVAVMSTWRRCGEKTAQEIYNAIKRIEKEELKNLLP